MGFDDNPSRILFCLNRSYFCRVAPTFVIHTLILCGAFPDSGRTGRELIYGSRKTIFGRDCLFKADVLYAIHPELYIVATPCVTANHRALVELTHGRPILTAFDQDFYENEAVCFHLASFIARRLRCERTLATTRIASWDASVKGIDDAAVRNLPIKPISVQSWLDRLRPRFRQIAMTRLYETVDYSL